MSALESADRFSIAGREIFVVPCFCHFGSCMLLNPVFNVCRCCLCLVEHFDNPKLFLQPYTGGARGLRGQGVTLEIVIIIHLGGLDLHRSRPARRRKLRPARYLHAQNQKAEICELLFGPSSWHQLLFSRILHQFSKLASHIEKF